MKRRPTHRYLPLYDAPLTDPEALRGSCSPLGADNELRRRLRERNANSLVNLQMKTSPSVVRIGQPSFKLPRSSLPSRPTVSLALTHKARWIALAAGAYDGA